MAGPVVLLVLAFEGYLPLLPVYSCVNSCRRVELGLQGLDAEIQRYIAELGQLPPEAGWGHAIGADRSYGFPYDPWGNRYRYWRRDRERLDYELMSIGPDGELGTSDDQVRAEQWRYQSAHCAEPGLVARSLRSWF